MWEGPFTVLTFSCLFPIFGYKKERGITPFFWGGGADEERGSRFRGDKSRPTTSIMGAECSRFCTCTTRVKKYAEEVAHRNEVASLPGESVRRFLPSRSLNACVCS